MIPLRPLRLAALPSLLLVTQAVASPVDSLLDRAASEQDLRTRLRPLVGAPPPAQAGEASYYLGLSFARGGAPESAFVHFERAVKLRGEEQEIAELSEALLRRGQSADLARVRALNNPRGGQQRFLSEWGPSASQGRLAWAHYLGGRPDSADLVFKRQERRLLHERNPLRREWGYRLAATRLQLGQAEPAMHLLTPLAVASRLQDRDVMQMVTEAGEKLGSAQIQSYVQNEVVKFDQEEQNQLAVLGARRARFAADDGFVLGGVIVAPAATTLRRAVVVILDREETPLQYDSLAAGLARAGYAVMLMDPRGTGHSVGYACPLPESWIGREAEMLRRVARDVPFALRALAESTPVDTSTYAVVGSGSVAVAAVEAVGLDRRARPLVLVTPAPSPVDRGPLRARLAALKPATFLQLGPEDVHAAALVEQLYRAVDASASRISETDISGGGPLVFRSDARIVPRLTLWLGESWPKGAGSKAKR